MNNQDNCFVSLFISDLKALKSSSVDASLENEFVDKITVEFTN